MASGYTSLVNFGDSEMTATLTLKDNATATFVAAMSYDVTYTKLGSAIVLEPSGELEEGSKADIWAVVPHIWVLDDESMTMTGYAIAYNASDFLLFTAADGTMRVEYPQYSMARDGFTYELSEDGTTLTVTSAPNADAMGPFQQIWDELGGEVWTISGSSATKVE